MERTLGKKKPHYVSKNMVRGFNMGAFHPHPKTCKGYPIYSLPL